MGTPVEAEAWWKGEWWSRFEDGELWWWRFDEYRIEAWGDREAGDTIEPVEGAAVAWYRPWDMYDPNGESEPPYLSLLRLLEVMQGPRVPYEPYHLSADETAALLRWCRLNGLLGAALGGLPAQPDRVETYCETAATIYRAASHLRDLIQAARQPSRSPLDYLKAMSRLLTAGGQPSLLGAFAQMALLDLVGRQLHPCQVCGMWFTGRRTEKRYCSPRCKRTAQKRAQRAHQRARARKEEGGNGGA